MKSATVKPLPTVVHGACLLLGCIREELLPEEGMNDDVKVPLKKDVQSPCGSHPMDQPTSKKKLDVEKEKE
jgi:hypothetical protein